MISITSIIYEFELKTLLLQITFKESLNIIFSIIKESSGSNYDYESNSNSKNIFK